MNLNTIQRKFLVFFLFALFAAMLPSNSQLNSNPPESGPKPSAGIDFTILSFSIENQYYCEGFVKVHADVDMPTSLPTVIACVNGTNYTMQPVLASDRISGFATYLCSLAIGLYQVKIFAGNASGWVSSSNKTFEILTHPNPFMYDLMDWNSGYFFASPVFGGPGWMNQFKFYTYYHYVNCSIPEAILKINGTSYIMNYSREDNQFYKYIDFGSLVSGSASWNITISLGGYIYTSNTYIVNLNQAIGHNLQIINWNQVVPTSNKVRSKLVFAFMNSINASFTGLKLQVNQNNVSIFDEVDEIEDEFEEEKQEDYAEEFEGEFGDCDIYIDYRFIHNYYYFYEFDAGVYNFTLWIQVGGVWYAYNLGMDNTLYTNLPNTGITYQWNNVMDNSGAEYEWLLNLTITTAILNFEIESIILNYKAPCFQRAWTSIGSIDYPWEDWADNDFTDGKYYYGTVYSGLSPNKPLKGDLGYYAQIKWTNGTGYGFLEIPIQYVNFTAASAVDCEWQEGEWVIYRDINEKISSCCCYNFNNTEYYLLEIKGEGYEFGYSYIDIEQSIWIECSRSWKVYRTTSHYCPYTFMYDETGYTNKFYSDYIRIYLDEDEYFDDYFWCDEEHEFSSIIQGQVFELYSVSGSTLSITQNLNCVTSQTTISYVANAGFVNFVIRQNSTCYELKTGRWYVASGTGPSPKLDQLDSSSSTGTGTTTGTSSGTSTNTSTSTGTSTGTGTTTGTSTSSSTTSELPNSSVDGYSIAIISAVMIPIAAILVRKNKSRPMA
jgi:hypothetical protein